MRSHNTKQRLMQKHVVVMHVYLHDSKSSKCHFRYTDSCVGINNGVNTQIQCLHLGRGSITLRHAVLRDKPTYHAQRGDKRMALYNKIKKDVCMQGTP